MSSKKLVYIIDLDNTLYLTWPTLVERKIKSNLVKHWWDENLRIIKLRSFRRFTSLVHKRIHNSDKKAAVLFLSARHWTLFPATLLRLAWDFKSLNFRLRLVPAMSAKPKVCRRVIERYEKVVMIDDFSFGHEYGRVATYQTELEEIKKMGIRVITGSRLSGLTFADKSR